VAPNSKKFNAASALTAAGIVLVAANWYVKPEAGLGWTAALVTFVAMAAVMRVSRRALRRATAEAAAARSLDSITTAVVFAALMMGIPLALTLARAFGLVDGTELARRSTGVLTGAFLAMLGNAMPKNLPPLSSMRCDGTRQQAFLRIAGWTWVLCGLVSAIGWLALSIDAAETTTMVLVVTATVMTITQILRLRRPRKSAPAHGLN
jgi:hypothetical protein